MDLQTATDYVRELLIRQDELYERIRTLESQVLDWKKRATSLDQHRPNEMYEGTGTDGFTYTVSVFPEWGESTGSTAWISRNEGNDNWTCIVPTMSLIWDGKEYKA